MEGAQHRDRGNGGAGQIGRDVLGDGRESQNVDVQHLAGATRRFEIFAAEIPQTEVQALPGRGLVDDVCVTFGAGCGWPSGSNRSGSNRILPAPSIDLTEVDIAKVDRDFLGVWGLWAQLA